MESAVGQGVRALARVAASSKLEIVEREFHDLFIGLGRGELLPYASFYMTGFLNEKPLAKLRDDMARLRIRRADDVYEPEDNIASLMRHDGGSDRRPIWRRARQHKRTARFLRHPHQPVGGTFLFGS